MKKENQTLPSGKRFEIVRKLKWRDAVNAGRYANPQQDMMGFTGAMVASIVKVDGKDVTPEDIAELDFDDVIALIEGSGLGKSPLVETYLGSPSSRAGLPKA